MSEKEKIKRNAILTLGFFAAIGFIYLGFKVEDQETSQQSTPSESDILPGPEENWLLSEEASSSPHPNTAPTPFKIKKLEAQGFDCEPIPKGSCLTQELRKRGAPGIDSGPYVIIHLDGEEQHFSDYNNLPDLVYPNETFCIKEIKPQSFNINPVIKEGVIFQAPTAKQLQQFIQKSNNIQAQIRAAQRF